MATQNMGLDLPTPTVTEGPEYATKNNDAFEAVDQHDHSSGKGVKIPSSGLNINDDVEFNENSATELKSTQYEEQSSDPSGNAHVYFKNGDFYIKNVSGTVVQVTSGASVNSSSSSDFLIYATQSVTTTPYTISSTDTKNAYFVNTSTAKTINLPLAVNVGAGRYYVFKDTSGLAGTNNITITPSGVDIIENNTGSLTLDKDDMCVVLISDGSSTWHLIHPTKLYNVNIDGGVIENISSIDVDGNITVSGTVDGVDIAALKSDFDSHDASTVEHGATGAVVGTTNTQTLTNKTLSGGTLSGTTTNSGTINGGAIANATSVGVNGNITVTGTVDGVDVAGLKTDVDGFPDELKNLTAAEVTQLENIGSTTISSTQWGYVGGQDQATKSTDDVEFNDITLQTTGEMRTFKPVYAVRSSVTVGTSNTTVINFTGYGDGTYIVSSHDFAVGTAKFGNWLVVINSGAIQSVITFGTVGFSTNTSGLLFQIRTSSGTVQAKTSVLPLVYDF